jgi:hypothetical protein
VRSYVEKISHAAPARKTSGISSKKQTKQPRCGRNARPDITSVETEFARAALDQANAAGKVSTYRRTNNFLKLRGVRRYRISGKGGIGGKNVV